MALALHRHMLARTLQAGTSNIFAVAVGFEGPIRSRLVENGYLGEGDVAAAVRQGSGPRAWPQQDETEANAFSGLPVSSNRPMVDNTSQRPLLTHGMFSNQGPHKICLVYCSDTLCTTATKPSSGSQ